MLFEVAFRQLNSASTAQSKSMEKLSSGLRINRAGDDAVGLAISEKMRGQIRGLDQAGRNAQDSISLIQTAEGALNETHSILQRMRELSVQSSNDTNTADDRAEIQKEVNQLKEEIDRISSTTEFNTKKLLNGNAGSSATISSTTNVALMDSASVVNADLATGSYTLTVSGTGTAAFANATDAGTGLATTDITVTAADAKYGSYQVKVTDDSENAGMKSITLIDTNTGEEIGTQNNVDTSVAGSTTIQGFAIDNTAVAGNGTLSFDYKNDYTFTLTDASSNQLATKTVTGLTDSKVEIGGIEFSFNADATDGATAFTVSNNSLTTHIGANKDQTMNIAINDMSSSALGVDDLDVTSQTGAESAIESLDSAIKSVSAERSKLGAYQNRLDHTINNLGTSAENLTAAESRVRDVDMAKEMMTQTKNSILSQAAQAMLAQANQQPQGVLQLLR